MSNSRIWPIDRTLSEWTWEQWHWRVTRIPQSSSITGTSPSDCLVTYPGHLLGWVLTILQRCNRSILLLQPTWSLVVGGSYHFTEMRVGVFYRPNRLSQFLARNLITLQRCSRCILQPQPTELKKKEEDLQNNVRIRSLNAREKILVFTVWSTLEN